jgi:hypothetical protein
MTIEEAIKHCEEVAYQNEILMKRYDDASGYNRSHNENIRTDGAKGCEQLISLYRQLAEWLRELKRNREILNGLSIYFQSLVVDAVINQRPLMFDMRDATNEERESVKRYIANSAKTTGVNFWSVIGEVNADEDSD